MHSEWIRKCIGLAVAFILVGVGNAYADPISLRISDGTATITVTDNGAGDFDTSVGSIAINSDIGTFTGLNFTAGAGSAGLAGPSLMHLNSVNSGGPGTLTISLTEQNLSVTPASFDMLFGGTLTAPAGSFAAGSVLLSTSNLLFTGSTIGSIGPFGPGAFSGSTTGGALVGGVYSLTTVMTINLTGPGTFSADLDVTPVPEPSSVLLFGTGLAGLAVWARKRQAAK